MDNFNEMIKIITNFFSGFPPNSENYASEELIKLDIYQNDLAEFYRKNLQSETSKKY